ALNDHQLLVTERSFSTGRLTCNIRVYLAELNGAENIAGVASLQQHPSTSPVRKKLLLNMDSLGRWIDNVEGATLGPRLPNGKRSLLFVTDDNFSSFERTQFLLFEVD
ncbi:MAG TPA: esterase-like activity of phytase family protein, partial [Flavisolibacter sp.]|nr:esterase-like activity of phytase family protein [Flavisolibacter sp.]